MNITAIKHKQTNSGYIQLDREDWKVPSGRIITSYIVSIYTVHDDNNVSLFDRINWAVEADAIKEFNLQGP